MLNAVTNHAKQEKDHSPEEQDGEFGHPYRKPATKSIKLALSLRPHFMRKGGT
jgi:hypothetical protein